MKESHILKYIYKQKIILYKKTTFRIYFEFFDINLLLKNFYIFDAR